MTSLKVAVRVRPLTDRESHHSPNRVVDIRGKEIIVNDSKVPGKCLHDSRPRIHKFTFDYGFWSVEPESEKCATQQTVYEEFGRVVLNTVLAGYNSCVIAYGPSGSGKTYTMMGTKEQAGLTPRICEGLFAKLSERTEHHLPYQVDISYLEIYNEQVFDLIRNNTPKVRLRVREHPVHGPFVEGLSTHVVRNMDEVSDLLAKGNEARVQADTDIHDRSSRSHAIFTIRCSQARLDAAKPREVVSKLQLVDLAGSEKVIRHFCQARIKEGGTINKSLVSLGNVISVLVDLSARGQPTSKTYVPYRNSNLTWLLKDSLGGNSHTFMVAAISPSKDCYIETISTLRYAQRAKLVMNTPIVNEDPSTEMIRNLRKEVLKLRQLLIAAENISKTYAIAPLPEVSYLQSIMDESARRVDLLTKHWFEKWLQTYNVVLKKVNNADGTQPSTSYASGQTKQETQTMSFGASGFSAIESPECLMMCDAALGVFKTNRVDEDEMEKRRRYSQLFSSESKEKELHKLFKTFPKRKIQPLGNPSLVFKSVSDTVLCLLPYEEKPPIAPKRSKSLVRFRHRYRPSNKRKNSSVQTTETESRPAHGRYLSKRRRKMNKSSPQLTTVNRVDVDEITLERRRMYSRLFSSESKEKELHKLFKTFPKHKIQPLGNPSLVFKSVSDTVLDLLPYEEKPPIAPKRSKSLVKFRHRYRPSNKRKNSSVQTTETENRLVKELPPNQDSLNHISVNVPSVLSTDGKAFSNKSPNEKRQSGKPTNFHPKNIGFLERNDAFQDLNEIGAVGQDQNISENTSAKNCSSESYEPKSLVGMVEQRLILNSDGNKSKMTYNDKTTRPSIEYETCSNQSAKYKEQSNILPLDHVEADSNSEHMKTKIEMSNDISAKSTVIENETTKNRKIKTENSRKKTITIESSTDTNFKREETLDCNSSGGAIRKRNMKTKTPSKNIIDAELFTDKIIDKETFKTFSLDLKDKKTFPNVDFSERVSEESKQLVELLKSIRPESIDSNSRCCSPKRKDSEIMSLLSFSSLDGQCLRSIDDISSNEETAGIHCNAKMDDLGYMEVDNTYFKRKAADYAKISFSALAQPRVQEHRNEPDIDKTKGFLTRPTLGQLNANEFNFKLGDINASGGKKRNTRNGISNNILMDNKKVPSLNEQNCNLHLAENHDCMLENNEDGAAKITDFSLNKTTGDSTLVADCCRQLQVLENNNFAIGRNNRPNREKVCEDVAVLNKRIHQVAERDFCESSKEMLHATHKGLKLTKANLDLLALQLREIPKGMSLDSGNKRILPVTKKPENSSNRNASNGIELDHDAAVIHEQIDSPSLNANDCNAHGNIIAGNDLSDEVKLSGMNQSLLNSVIDPHNHLMSSVESGNENGLKLVGNDQSCGQRKFNCNEQSISLMKFANQEEMELSSFIMNKNPMLKYFKSQAEAHEKSFQKFPENFSMNSQGNDALNTASLGMDNQQANGKFINESSSFTPILEENRMDKSEKGTESDFNDSLTLDSLDNFDQEMKAWAHKYLTKYNSQQESFVGYDKSQGTASASNVASALDLREFEFAANSATTENAENAKIMNDSKTSLSASCSTSTSSDSITYVFVGKEETEAQQNLIDTTSSQYSSLVSSVSLDSLERIGIQPTIPCCLSPRTLSMDSLIAEELIQQIKNGDIYPFRRLSSWQHMHINRMKSLNDSLSNYQRTKGIFTDVYKNFDFKANITETSSSANSQSTHFSNNHEENPPKSEENNCKTDLIVPVDTVCETDSKELQNTPSNTNENNSGVIKPIITNSQCQTDLSCVGEIFSETCNYKKVDEVIAEKEHLEDSHNQISTSDGKKLHKVSSSSFTTEEKQDVIESHSNRVSSGTSTYDQDRNPSKRTQTDVESTSDDSNKPHCCDSASKDILNLTMRMMEFMTETIKYLKKDRERYSRCCENQKRSCNCKRSKKKLMFNYSSSESSDASDGCLINDSESSEDLPIKDNSERRIQKERLLSRIKGDLSKRKSSSAHENKKQNVYQFDTDSTSTFTMPASNMGEKIFSKLNPKDRSLDVQSPSLFYINAINTYAKGVNNKSRPLSDLHKKGNMDKKSSEKKLTSFSETSHSGPTDHLKQLAEIRRRIVEKTKNSNGKTVFLGQNYVKQDERKLHTKSDELSNSSSQGYLSSLSSHTSENMDSDILTESSSSRSAEGNKSPPVSKTVRSKELTLDVHIKETATATPTASWQNTSADSGTFLMDSPLVDKTEFLGFSSASGGKCEATATDSHVGEAVRSKIRLDSSLKLVGSSMETHHCKFNKNSAEARLKMNSKRPFPPTFNNSNLTASGVLNPRRKPLKDIHPAFRHLDELGEEYRHVNSEAGATSLISGEIKEPCMSDVARMEFAKKLSDSNHKITRGDIEKILASIEADKMFLRRRRNPILDQSYSPEITLCSPKTSSESLLSCGSYKKLPNPVLYVNSISPV